MVDMDWKAKMNNNITSNSPNKSPKFSNKLTVLVPPPATRVADLVPAPDTDCTAYENYLRLPELKKLWTSKDFPDWENESVIKPGLQALEITFRFISTVLSDPRPYTNLSEWKRRLVSLATSQLQIIAMLCEDGGAAAPISDLSSSGGVLAREDSSAEVWKLNGDATVVSRACESSLLPRLATWEKAEDVAMKVMYSIECEMRNCPYTLGLGEPNLSGKPSLDYELICKPLELRLLKKCSTNIDNPENQTLYTIHQILESWVYVSQELLNRIGDRIGARDFKSACSDCWVLEKTWKLLAEIEDLHLLMDPNDFLKLRNQLLIKTSSESGAFCFRSRALVDITKRSKELRHNVPHVLDVEVDPTGGPRIQEAAMDLYRRKGSGGSERIHLLQALQGIEAALKRFYYSYKQLVVNVMGSLEVKGKYVNVDSGDLLGQIYLEPTYYPSLDAAKTFLGDYWLSRENRGKK